MDQKTVGHMVAENMDRVSTVVGFQRLVERIAVADHMVSVGHMVSADRMAVAGHMVYAGRMAVAGHMD